MSEQPEKPSILVIDDDWVNRELMETVLKRGGYTVTTANTGHSGIQAVAQLVPQLVIVDLRLPDMNGVEVIQAIRAMDLPHPVRIVVMSAMDRDTVSAQVVEAGADMFISKVFQVSDLLTKLKGLLQSG
ncbi:MAG: response regulator [Anaerolineae bacterium]